MTTPRCYDNFTHHVMSRTPHKVTIITRVKIDNDKQCEILLHTALIFAEKLCITTQSYSCSQVDFGVRLTANLVHSLQSLIFSCIMIYTYYIIAIQNLSALCADYPGLGSIDYTPQMLINILITFSSILCMYCSLQATSSLPLPSLVTLSELLPVQSLIQCMIQVVKCCSVKQHYITFGTENQGYSILSQLSLAL